MAKAKAKAASAKKISGKSTKTKKASSSSSSTITKKTKQSTIITITAQSRPKVQQQQQSATATTTTTTTQDDEQSISIQCWAHSLAGNRCTSKVSSREGEPIPIPYCDTHLKSGDGAVKVVSHPLFGKALVARHDLPAKYRLAYWGIRGRCQTCDVEDRAISYYPPNPMTGSNIDPREAKEGRRTLKTNNYNGVLNPGGTGDVVQYAACPGPNERQNMKSTFQYYGLRNGIVGGLEFVTLMPVPKGTQLLHWYGSGWWSERGIKRQDVGTKRYPAPLRLPKKKEGSLVKCKKARATKKKI